MASDMNPTGGKNATPKNNTQTTKVARDRFEENQPPIYYLLSVCGQNRDQGALSYGTGLGSREDAGSLELSTGSYHLEMILFRNKLGDIDLYRGLFPKRSDADGEEPAYFTRKELLQGKKEISANLTVHVRTDVGVDHEASREKKFYKAIDDFTVDLGTFDFQPKHSQIHVIGRIGNFWVKKPTKNKALSKHSRLANFVEVDMFFSLNVQP